jgi:Ni,Fe-hydrogenase III large subunit
VAGYKLTPRNHKNRFTHMINGLRKEMERQHLSQKPQIIEKITKQVKSLHDMNFKSPKKENEEDNQRMERSPMLVDL